MKIIKNPKNFQKEMMRLRTRGKTLGFVPTMGALHEGHLALVRASKKENDVTVVSIFVNPLQFGPKEDLSRYPRPVKEDVHLLEKEKVDTLFFPNASRMYPDGFSTKVELDKKLTGVLCGSFRPGHFEGVATVVAKLFHLAQPHRVYFGAKDYQQSVIIAQMIRDLDFGIVFRRMPTVRETDGLAMSSRNRYLSGAERRRALEISKTLFNLKQAVEKTPGRLMALRLQAKKYLRRHVDLLQYLEVVDPETLQPVLKPSPEMAVLAACIVGKTRLIDNVIIRL